MRHSWCRRRRARRLRRDNHGKNYSESKDGGKAQDHRVASFTIIA
jgi:hypothetical protein